jgi:hypothetical protein
VKGLKRENLRGHVTGIEVKKSRSVSREALWSARGASHRLLSLVSKR